MKKNKYLLTENPGSICIHDREFNSICDFWKDSENQKELSTLSQIAVDAFNTANKCGLFPSELLGQNSLLMEALIEIRRVGGLYLCGELACIIRNTINQIEQQTKTNE